MTRPAPSEARALVTRGCGRSVDGKTVHQVGVPCHWGSRGLDGRLANDLIAISEEPNVRIMEAKGLLCDVEAGPPASRMPEAPSIGAATRRNAHGRDSRHSSQRNQARHKYVAEGTKVGFFTDPTVCIGCKACEVACKEWNNVPEDGLMWTGHSYDNSGSLGASTWRHVKFLELDRASRYRSRGPATEGGNGEPIWLAVSVRCLQALRARRLPGSLSHGRDLSNGSELGLRAGRCLQRLRLLHRRVSVRGD